jgi:hypothetical protein
MTKLLSALRRTLESTPDQQVHFHQGTTAHSPEVCHESTCSRPRLKV